MEYLEYLVKDVHSPQIRENYIQIKRTSIELIKSMDVLFILEDFEIFQKAQGIFFLNLLF